MGKPRTEVEPFQNELRTLRKALGNRIRELRKLRDWSQEEFADNAHIHRTFAGSLERGEKNVSFHGLVLISRCFGITLSELLGGIEAGESASSTGRRHKARGVYGTTDRRRVLSELTTLEKSLRTLREITLKSK
jgi:transcriptional regulator with XRE-family HTH domain